MRTDGDKEFFGHVARLIALAALLGMAAITLLACQGQAATAPHLQVDRDQIDLGAVPVGQHVDATFHLKNTGGTPLQIVGTPSVVVVQGC